MYVFMYVCMCYHWGWFLNFCLETSIYDSEKVGNLPEHGDWVEATDGTIGLVHWLTYIHTYT